EGGEERGGVGDVDQGGLVVLRAYFPNGVELWVVDLHQLAVLVAVAQAEELVKLQPAGARLEARLQPLRLALAPVRIIDAIEVEEREGKETAGVRLVERGD